MEEIEQMRADLQRERGRADRMSQRVLDEQIRAAAATAGLHRHAVDDAMNRGRAMFRLDDDGQAVQLGEDGHPVLGKDGKTPLGLAEWLDGMKVTAPHWFPANASGSGGGSGERGGGIHRQDRSLMTPAEKAAYIAKHGRDSYMAIPMSGGRR